MSQTDLASLSSLFGPQVLNETINISFRHRYIYFEVPKAGSTSILSALHEMELRSLPGAMVPEAHCAPVTSPCVKPYQLSDSQFLALLRNPDFFKFTFVRNPYARILSAYLDKILSNDPITSKYFRDELQLPTTGHVPYVDFLKRVSRQSPVQMNKHWRLQTEQSCSSFCTLDFVGKLEHFQRDFDYVRQRVGHNLPAIGHVAPHATGAVSKLTTHYSDDAVEWLQSIYAADFQTFEYDPNILG